MSSNNNAAGGASSSSSSSSSSSFSASDAALAASIEQDNKNRRMSKRVANATNGKKAHKQEKSKKMKKPLCTVDFAKLEMSSLLRYKRHFKLPLRPSAPKIELISSVRKHFVHHPRMRDVDVISSFLYANSQQKIQNKVALQHAATVQNDIKTAATQAAAAAQQAQQAQAGGAQTQKAATAAR